MVDHSVSEIIMRKTRGLLSIDNMFQSVDVSKVKKKPSYFLRPPRVVIGITSQFPLEVDRVQFCLAIDIRPRAILGGFSAL